MLKQNFFKNPQINYTVLTKKKKIILGQKFFVVLKLF